MENEKLTSVYKGGRTAQFVRIEIKNRFGIKAAKEYNVVLEIIYILYEKKVKYYGK